MFSFLPTLPKNPTTPSPFRGPPHGHGVRNLRSGGGTRPPAQQLAAQGAFPTAPVAVQVIATPSGDPLGRNLVEMVAKKRDLNIEMINEYSMEVGEKQKCKSHHWSMVSGADKHRVRLPASGVWVKT